MAAPTRVIVTSQPDVACDVCGRRLLRGEQPDTFLAAGRRRTVCELCAPRASAEGWVRESASHEVGLPDARPRRGRNLLSRLRQPRERTSPGGELEPRETAARPIPAGPLSEVEPVVAHTEVEPGAPFPDADPGAPLGPETRATAQPVPAAAFAGPATALAAHGDLADGSALAARRDPAGGSALAAHGDLADGSAPAAHGAPADGPAVSGEEHEEEPEEERGSWRDAWMFVEE